MSHHPSPRTHEEIEVKWALAPDAYGILAQQLARELGPPRSLAQTNRFFDTADRRLRAARMNIRLRHENGRVLLTCKHKAADVPAGLVDGVSRHQEWERWLEPELASGAADPAGRWTALLPAGVRTALGDAALEDLGGFANHRLEFATARDGLAELLALDRTDFAVRIDHELEIETADPALTGTWWRERLVSWGVAWRPQTTTKFARFLALAPP